MLNLYYGRESQDKEGFLYDSIAEVLTRIDRENEHVLLVVPDQYTLQAERNAISYLKVNGLIEFEILSQGRLADRILAETGGSTRVHIDKQGRQMLLSGIISEESENLNVFRGMERFHSFIEMTNDLISEMKQYDTDLSRLSEVIAKLDDKSMLCRKLQDVYRIYERYEHDIAGKYTDSEDFIKLLLTKIPQSRLVKNTEFWVYGFESFSPQTIRLLAELERNSHSVSVILTGDDSEKDQSLFALCQKMKKKLAEAVGNDHFSAKPIQKERPAVAEPIAHLEQTLFSHPAPVYRGDLTGLTLCRAANYYSEAESAAAYITELVRDKGLRYRDIAVICNDTEVRGAAIKRVFTEYGLRFFMDEKRRVMHDPIVGFISALLDVVTDNFLYEDVFLLLKTDLTPLEQEEYEALENYALRYRIRGKRWKKDFLYGEKEYGEEELFRLNTLRERLISWISPFEHEFREAVTVAQKTEALLEFLTGDAALPARIDQLLAVLDEDGEYEAALEISQIWESMQGLFVQFGELMNDRQITADDYRSIVQTGFASIELGLIPPTIDEMVVGTMSRTRVGPIKALIVLGANDGVLPAGAGEDDLLSRDERTLLLGKNIEICKDDDLRMMEERLAIYKNLSKARQYLWMSFSSADPEGKEIRPSIIFNKLTKIFPDIEIEKDILNREMPLPLIERPKSTIKHLTTAFLDAAEKIEEPAPEWKAALKWYRKKEDKNLGIAMQGMSFNNHVEKLEAQLVKKLFKKGENNDLTLSPSRIEKFSRCPFAHLVLYGLSPEELRVFEVAGREVGDVYHECLMLLAQNLSVPGKEITDPESPWMKLSEDACKKMIGSFIDQVSAEYREGVLLSGQEERYRTERMKEVCARAAFALVRHVQQGRVKKIYFEESFGEDAQKLFPAITVPVGENQIRIEGKIDRADVLENDYVKIIDYKSGKERFDAKEAKGGWRLQLMLYLKAAMDGISAQGQEAKPAGVFYFEIADPLIDATAMDASQLSEKLEKELRRAFKLDGIVVNEPSVIRDMAGEFSGYSDILPLYRNKEGELKGTTEAKLLSQEQFADLQGAVGQTVERLCADLVSGVADIHPKKTAKETACDFCRYKSICNFELSFDGCSYDVVI